MRDIFIYLFKVSAGLVIIFLPYYFLFRNDPNLVIKRFYLLSGVLAAWIFPFITFRKLPLAVDLTPTVFIDLDTPVVTSSLMQTSASSAGISINWLQVLLLVYLSGISFMFLKNLFVIFKWNLTWKRNKNDEGVAFIKNNQVFTLFTRIFVPGSLKDEQDLDNVLLHEKAHIQQLHFIDLMMMEFTLLLTWFNPFSWLISRMIKENHEHLADRQVLSAGVNPARYRAQLMNHTLGVNVFRLGNQFNHSLTLNRFKMMKKPKRSPWGILKIAMLIPAVLITMGLTTGMTPQQKTITGKVVMADTGEPIPGASILIRNGTRGCVSDIDGNFMLNVDGDPELIISFVGLETLIVKSSKIGKKPLELKVKTYDLDLESVPLEVKKEASGAITLRLKDGSEAQPVFVVDGKEVKGVDHLDPDQIESLEVIKDPNDPMVKKYKAKDGIILITTKDGNETNDVFYVVENMPTFNGGEPAQEFRKFIAQNLQYPKSAAAKGVDGRVIVQFRITKSGQVADAVVVRSLDPTLDKEAIRVVNSSPRWTPGEQRGKPVDVLFTFPINFVIQDPEKHNKEESAAITLKKSDGSDALTLKADKLIIQGTDGSMADPVYVVDGEVVDGIENLNSDLIESISVIKDTDNPLVIKHNAKDGLILITTKEAAAAAKKEEKEVFYVVEDMPHFPGGKTALKTYIYTNLEYPEEARNKDIEGHVIVQWMIDNQGQTKDVKAIQSTYEGFNDAAMKVIREMPEWTPGKQRGKPVNVMFTTKIQFNDDKK
jgi:TonB family protein